jgi:hypothetical protein
MPTSTHIVNDFTKLLVNKTTSFLLEAVSATSRDVTSVDFEFVLGFENVFIFYSFQFILRNSSLSYTLLFLTLLFLIVQLFSIVQFQCFKYNKKYLNKRFFSFF